MHQTVLGRRVTTRFKIDMPEAHQKIWVKIRAELIVYYHERINPNKFEGGMSLEYATRMAKNHLHYDMTIGELRISLEDMLSLSNDECLDLLENYKKEKVDQMISRMNLKRKGDVDCD